MLTKSCIAELNSQLHDTIITQEPLHGGDINACYKISCESCISYAVKVNSAKSFPQMYEFEKSGLELLASLAGVQTPKVIANFDIDGMSFLVLEYLDSAESVSQSDLGVMLAKLHAQHNESFGLDTDNYIGSIVQKNGFESTWQEFYGMKRLTYMFKMAYDKYPLPAKSSVQLSNLCQRLDEIFPVCKPSLLHGDLWNGNVLHSLKHGWVLIDPAVYYGHPEMDLGMMKLFGGFSEDCFDAYTAYSVVQPDWPSRIEYTQLYPLLVHLNLFGMGYWRSIENTLSKF